MTFKVEALSKVRSVSIPEKTGLWTDAGVAKDCSVKRSNAKVSNDSGTG